MRGEERRGERREEGRGEKRGEERREERRGERREVKRTEERGEDTHTLLTSVPAVRSRTSSVTSRLVRISECCTEDHAGSMPSNHLLILFKFRLPCG